MGAMMGGAAAGGGVGLGIDLSQIDLSGVVAGQYRVLPEELDYEAEIQAVDPERSQNGNPMLKLTLKVTFPTEFAGTKLWDRVVLTEASMWKFKSLAKACDLLDPDGAKFIGQGPQDFKDYVVRFRIKHDLYNGAIQNKVNGGYAEGYETPGLSAAASEGTPQPNWT